jgi:hypothetical protein
LDEVSRLKFVLISALALVACLALAAGAAAKPRSAAAPHKGGSAKGGLVVQVPKAPALTVGTKAKLKVGVANKGPRPIAGVVLLAKASKGITVKPAKVKVGRLAPGKKAVETFKVAVTAAGAKPSIGFTAKAPGQPTVHKGLAIKGAGSGGGKEPAPPKASAIVGHYFWRSELILSTTYLHGYYFVDEHWVYRGIPEGGLPVCTAQTAQGEEDGCLPYTYDEATGALNIAGTAGSYVPATKSFKVGEIGYSEAVPAAAGTKLDASGSYINGFGICPSFCSFTTSEISLSSAGEFARGSTVQGFFGEGGSYGALPPEEHGTYAINSRGVITFTYASGKVVNSVISFMLNEQEVPDANYGMLIDGFDFFGPHSNV